MTDWVLKEHGVSKQRACRVTGLSRSVYAYVARRDDKEQIVERLGELSGNYPMEGFWKLYGRMRQEGDPWNHKRVWPIYQAMGNRPTKYILPRFYSLQTFARQNSKIWKRE